MSVDIITDKYSTAIFELAEENHILEQMETDLSYVKEVLDSQPELKALLVYPALDAKKKCDVLGKVFGTAIHTLALHFLYVMVERGRGRYLSATIREYLRKSWAARGIMEATETVAEPLSDELETKLKDKLKAITGKQYIFDVKVDPSVIGGFVIKIGDTRIDASMARRLEDLKTYLLKAGTTEIGVNG